MIVEAKEQTHIEKIADELQKAQEKKRIEKEEREHRETAKARQTDALNMKFFYSDMSKDKKKMDEYHEWVREQKIKHIGEWYPYSIEYYKLKKGGCLYF